MPWLTPIQANMSISNHILETTPSNPVIALIQSIAIYTLIPISLIFMFEAVAINFIFVNLTNATIAVLNQSHDLWLAAEKVYQMRNPA